MPLNHVLACLLVISQTRKQQVVCCRHPWRTHHEVDYRIIVQGVRLMHYQVVFIIHGVGDQRDGYSEAFQEAVQQHVGAMSQCSAADVRVLYKEIRWSEETQDIQDALAERFDTVAGLGQQALRGIMLNLVGDALAYQESVRGRHTYDAIHAHLDQARREVREEIGRDVEYSIVAHSLGSVIASDYCHNNRDDFQLTNFFTMGSPIALWCMRAGMPDAADQPIQVIRPHGAWINILDDDDIIGWPLKAINEHYDRAVDFDYLTQIGGPISRTLPTSHRGYWTDGNAHKPIAKKLALDQERLVCGAPYDREAYLAYIRSLWNV